MPVSPLQAVIKCESVGLLLLYFDMYGESCLNPLTKIEDFSENLLSSSVFLNGSAFNIIWTTSVFATAIIVT